jgi:protein involved in polysaccharide export with SLBB domain
VYIRPVPGYQQPLRVEVVGEVKTPGTYVLEQAGERLSSVIGRAGGVTSRGSLDGFRLLRDGVAVGVSLDRAMERRGTADDIPLMDGDRLVVPTFDGTVLVTGAVQFTTRVVYRDGMSLDDAIAAAGGFGLQAEKKAVSIEYANGARATVRRFLGLTVSKPDVRPGSTVFVPARDESDGGFNWDSALTRVLTIASTMATLIIATR